MSGLTRIFWTTWVGCTQTVSAADPAIATMRANPRFRAVTDPSESMMHKLVSSDANREPVGTNLFPNGSVASTTIVVARPSFTSVVSCAVNATELTSTGLATAGTVRVALCFPTATRAVRPCASAARVPSTQTVVTSPRESVTPPDSST